MTKELKKVFVTAYWKRGVLTWRTKNRNGTDPMKKKPSNKEVQVLLTTIFGKEVDLEFLIDDENIETTKLIIKALNKLTDAEIKVLGISKTILNKSNISV